MNIGSINNNQNITKPSFKGVASTPIPDGFKKVLDLSFVADPKKVQDTLRISNNEYTDKQLTNILLTSLRNMGLIKENVGTAVSQQVQATTSPALEQHIKNTANAIEQQIKNTANTVEQQIKNTANIVEQNVKTRSSFFNNLGKGGKAGLIAAGIAVAATGVYGIYSIGKNIKAKKQKTVTQQADTLARAGIKSSTTAMTAPATSAKTALDPAMVAPRTGVFNQFA
jgi:exonuclease V gamma subunit